MAEATFEPVPQRRREPRQVAVPGYPLDPDEGAEAGLARRPSGFWRVVAGVVQALLCLFVILAALSTVIRF